jgi:hypothetical protein
VSAPHRLTRKRSRFIDRMHAAGTSRRDCSQKVDHPSKKVAEGVLRQMVKAHGPARTARLSAYKCPLCQRWHLGNRVRTAPNEVE